MAEVSKYLEMRHRSGLRPDIVAFALYRHRAHCVSLVALEDLDPCPDYPLVKARKGWWPFRDDDKSVGLGVQYLICRLKVINL